MGSFRYVVILAVIALAAEFTGCTAKDSPDEIRERTAQATATMRRDAKAVAEGVKEGISRDKTVDINKASREDLMSLPGVSASQADSIVAKRPFADTHQLVTRHVLSEGEYGQIKERVIAGR